MSEERSSRIQIDGEEKFGREFGRILMYSREIEHIQCVYLPMPMRVESRSGQAGELN